MFADIDLAIHELREAIGAGHPCNIESEMAELIARDLTPAARLENIDRTIEAKRAKHQKFSHLIKLKQQLTTMVLAAA